MAVTNAPFRVSDPLSSGIFCGSTDPLPRVTFLGDSITAEPTSYVGVLLNMARTAGELFTARNHAASGASLLNAGYLMAPQVVAAANDNAAKIFILIGTNDTIVTDAFRAEYQAEVEDLQASNPDATIYLLGILNRFDGITRRNTQNPLIATVATNTSTTYIDTDDWIEAADTRDNLHPNASGFQKIADQLDTYVY
jgi:lysophospholipase L1-like esterase